MIWYTLYLIAGLCMAGVVLFHVHDMRKHTDNCDEHPDVRKVLNLIDGNPILLPLITLLAIGLWWYVAGLYVWAYFGGSDDDDDDSDPQANVPPMYR